MASWHTAAMPERPARSRIGSLDALRGVGILGILALNVQLFALVAAARANPTVHGDLGGANWLAWLAIYALADGKFTGVFALLFGAGILIFADKPDEDARVVARLHYRRMAALIAIGLAHAYLLWSGDILVTLALCGAAVFPFRAAPPRRLVVVGVAVFAMASLLMLASGLALSRIPARELREAERAWAPPADVVADQVARYRAGWWTQMTARVPAAFEMETTYFVGHGAWQMGGLMLVGMGLLKLDVLTAGRSTAFYARLAVAGFGLGWTALATGASHSFRHHWALADYLRVGGPLTSWGNALVGLGWIGLVMLGVRAGWPLGAVAAVGRTALTNYLLQTVLCTTIFYGHGLGLFGRVGCAGQLAIVAGVWVIELVLSLWWLRRFDFGPVEWLWRCATYGGWLAIRRSSAITAVALPVER